MVSVSLRENRRSGKERNPLPSPYPVNRTAEPTHPARASRYEEPAHLRHRPGDDWIIDTNRPYDPDDPGPFGSPGWRPDRRTGRHRRNGLPDPLPASGEDEPYRFDPLRESAWDAYMVDSEDLARAHHRPGRWSRSTALEREAGGQWALWIW